MAMADYRLCDVCGGKAFYDSNLAYEYGESTRYGDSKPYRIAGAEQMADKELNEKCGMRLDRIGDWAVICTNCSETHETAIRPRPTTQETGGEG